MIASPKIQCNATVGPNNGRKAAHQGGQKNVSDKFKNFGSANANLGLLLRERMRRCVHWMLLLLVLGVASGCGGGSSAPTEDAQVATPYPPGAPAGLWRAPDDRLPVLSNYVYLHDRSALGREREYVYTSATSVVDVSSLDARVTLTVRGDESWFGDMRLPAPSSAFTASYHEGLKQWPAPDPTQGALQWWGLTAACDQLVAWFAVDSATYREGQLVAIEARFEQRCPSGASLRGQFRWQLDDRTLPPSAAPVPPTLWQPAPSAVPSTGNYVYLQSATGDPLGDGAALLYTPADAVIGSDSAAGLFSVQVRGDRYWDGRFRAMSHEARLKVGYYADLRRYPFHNPAKGGMLWSDPGRICEIAEAWFAVDSIAHNSAGGIESIAMRFEQRCEGAASPLRGALRWSANEIAPFKGPLNPVPGTFWAPAAGPTPTTSTHWYLESDAADPVGLGQTFLLSAPEVTLTFEAEAGRIRWRAEGQSTAWTAEFRTMENLDRIEEGLYAGLGRPGAHNPTRGAFHAFGDGAVCLNVDAWVVVDRVLYVGSELREIDLRFEQRCDNATGVLRGALTWRAESLAPALPTP